jgi:transmembrane sensor
MNEEQIIRIITGQLSTIEEREVLKWVGETSENRENYYRYLNLWALASQKQTSGKASKKDVEQFQKLISNKNKIDIITYVNIFAKYAAVIFLAFFVGKIFFQPANTTNNTMLSNQIVVPLGSKSNVRLPDGTEVTLNAGSKLTYDFNYGKKDRVVSLVGEAYFKVAKNKNKPFIVNTSKANIKALGTEFNVKAYPDENEVEAILVEGSIQINRIKSPDRKKGAKNNDEIVLKPGQKLSITDEQMPEKKIPDSKHQPAKENQNKQLVMNNNQVTEVTNVGVETSWKDSKWVIQGARLDQLAVLLSRRFNVSIQLKDEELNNYKFSATIQNETIEQIFSIMKLAIPMTYYIEKGSVSWFVNHDLEKDYNKIYKKELKCKNQDAGSK